MGIATDHLLGFAIDPSLAGYSAKESLSVQNGVRGALAGLPGTKWVGGTTDPVLSGNQERRSLQIEGYSAPQGEDVAVEAPHITPGYMQALGIPLIAGRDLSEGRWGEHAEGGARQPELRDEVLWLTPEGPWALHRDGWSGDEAGHSDRRRCGRLEASRRT